jgi:ribonuclease HI
VAGVGDRRGGLIRGSLERRIRSAADAEYLAIVLGLDLAAAHEQDPLEVRSDSQIAIDALAEPGRDDPRAAEVGEAAARFGDVRWVWHPRAENELADALVRAELWGE